jgi:hypothetical protein
MSLDAPYVILSRLHTTVTRSQFSVDDLPFDAVDVCGSGTVSRSTKFHPPGLRADQNEAQCASKMFSILSQIEQVNN